MLTTSSVAQDSLSFRKEAPAFYFDCDFCNQQFYRQNLSYVNFVRDRHLADIYVLLTLNQLGGGGGKYNLFFVGQNKFKNQNDTFFVETMANQPEAEIREAILAQLKKGLLKYLVQTNLLDKINYTIDVPENDMSANTVKDKWNFWTFTINGNMNTNGNSYQKYLNTNIMAYGNRTTEKLKTETGTWNNSNTQEFKINDSTTIKGKQTNLGAYHLLAFSVGKHFGIGQFATFFQSSPSNLWHSISYYPTFEYNVFPYSEASRRQLRFIYRIGARNQKYIDTTIFNKTNDWFGLHSLVFQYTQIEKWGNVNISAGAWHYFNYSKNYNIALYPAINFNPAKGLRIGVWGGFNIQNDQFFLRKSDASSEEILLNQVNLATNYNYNFGVSLGYTFGSKFNNIINVRFDINDNYW